MKNKINKGFRLGKKERLKIATRKHNLELTEDNIEQIRNTKSIYAITSAYRGFSYHGGKSKKCRFANTLTF